MRVTVMGIFTAEGTVEQLSEYTARLILLLKHWADQLESEDIRNEIEAVWRSLQKKDGTDQ